MKPNTRRRAWLFGVPVVLVAGAAGFIWSGVYNVAADDTHTRPVHFLLETTRERSIATRAGRLDVPSGLDDPARIVQGSGNYAAMCAGCHLAPGMPTTEMSQGLYPAPPHLSKHEVDAAKAFWVIKHGIKASGMPAWGKSMGDEYIWNMAAFLQVLPTLDAAAYTELVESSKGHSHGGGETHDHAHGDAGASADVDVPAAAEAAVTVTEQFNTALSSGDLRTVETLLAPDVLILESGGAERRREEYMAHHAASDAAFLKGAHRQVLHQRARTAGEFAWVGTESELHAQNNGKALTVLSVETMVLKQTADGWRIVHIHWSSRTKP